MELILELLSDHSVNPADPPPSQARPAPQIDSPPQARPTPQIDPAPEARPAPQIDPAPQARPTPQIDPSPQARPTPQIDSSPRDLDPRALAWVTQKGGSVINDRDVDGGQHVWVRCGADHEWPARISNLVSGHWCSECYGNKSLTIADMREIALARGGECLSEGYYGNKAHLLWKCKEGHEWPATPGNVKNHGSWCPHCPTNVGEELVRATLEEAFPGRNFDRTRREPWMEGLELDGFNGDLRLAFEFQGKQHFERVAHFQRTEGALEAQLARDALKVALCKEAAVTLLVVSYEVGFKSIRAFVRSELGLLAPALALAPATDTDGAFLDRIRARGNDVAFRRVVEAVRKKGGECLSTRYIAYRVRMTVKCREGHVFEATPESLLRFDGSGPRFCPKCGGKSRTPDDVVRALVEGRGFEFIGVVSEKKGTRRRLTLTIRCRRGHVTEPTLENFKRKSNGKPQGCKVCHYAENGAAKRNDISDWEVAHSVYAAEEYTSDQKEIEWICNNEHTFKAKFVILAKKGAFPCTECWLETFAQSRCLLRFTDWTDECESKTPLDWLCCACNATFTASRITLGRTEHPCPTLGCDERKKAAREKAAQEKAAQEEAAQEKAAQEEAAQEEAVLEEAAQEGAAQEEAAQEKATQ